MEASEPIKQEVSALTAGKTTTLQKMQAIAGFVQHDIRYVAIELGIGGWQPHAAPDVFSHRYGDCKDKATLMRTMLRQIGVDSYQVVINMQRGSVTRDTPAHNGFDHVILAIKLPDDVKDPSLIAVMQHPKLGRILFFDPTNELTPFGQIGGYLQANYGLLVTPEGGELVELPQQPSAMNSIQRVGKLTLDANGMLKGDVQEVRLGDRASSERWRLRTVTKDDGSNQTDRKPSGGIASQLSNCAGERGQRRTHGPAFRLQLFFRVRQLRKECGKSAAGAAAGAGKQVVRDTGDQGAAEVPDRIRRAVAGYRQFRYRSATGL